MPNKGHYPGQIPGQIPLVEAREEEDPARSPLTLSQALVLAVIRRLGEATDDELVTIYRNAADRGDIPDQSPSGIRSRRAELVRRGYVTDTGRITTLASGRSATVWRSCPP